MYMYLDIFYSVITINGSIITHTTRLLARLMGHRLKLGKKPHLQPGRRDVGCVAGKALAVEKTVARWLVRRELIPIQGRVQGIWIGIGIGIVLVSPHELSKVTRSFYIQAFQPPVLQVGAPSGIVPHMLQLAIRGHHIFLPVLFSRWGRDYCVLSLRSHADVHARNRSEWRLKEGRSTVAAERLSLD